MSKQDPVPHGENIAPPASDHNNQMALSERAGVYVYCVAPGDRWRHGEALLDVTGVGDRGDRIRVVHDHTGNLAALVSDSPRIRYPISKRNLLTHERVLERAMEFSDLLPMQFGKVATSDQEVIVALLEGQGHLLQELLERVRGKIELSLNVEWRRGALFAEIVAEDPAIRHLRDAMIARPTFSEQLMLGQMVERVITSKREREAQRILAALQSHAVDIRLNAVRSEMTVLNGAFLVNRATIEKFDEAVGRLEAQSASSLTIRYVGPLPPYSFVNGAVGLDTRWEG